MRQPHTDGTPRMPPPCRIIFPSPAGQKSLPTAWGGGRAQRWPEGVCGVDFTSTVAGKPDGRMQASAPTCRGRRPRRPGNVAVTRASRGGLWAGRPTHNLPVGRRVECGGYKNSARPKEQALPGFTSSTSPPHKSTRKIAFAFLSGRRLSCRSTASRSWRALSTAGCSRTNRRKRFPTLPRFFQGWPPSGSSPRARPGRCRSGAGPHAPLVLPASFSWPSAPRGYAGRVPSS